jgi:hypothetical protein
MRRVKRFLAGLGRACLRTVGGAFAGAVLAAVILADAHASAVLLLAAPMALTTGLLALLWPFAFGRRRRRW